MAEFDASYLAAASDELRKAGLDDAADWMLAKVRQEAGKDAARTRQFHGIPLRDLANRLARMASKQHNREDTRTAFIAMEAMLSILGEQRDALLAIPENHDESATAWNLVRIPPTYQGDRVVLPCPNCSRGHLPSYWIGSELHPRRPSSTVYMGEIYIRLESLGHNSPGLYVGQCDRCNSWFVG
jgi:hypothetical protein